MSTQKSTHGHAVLRMMIEADRPFTSNSLRAAIAERFGVESRFHTCSSESLTAQQLIEFFVDRGKLRPVEGGWKVDRAEICGNIG